MCTLLNHCVIHLTSLRHMNCDHQKMGQEQVALGRLQIAGIGVIGQGRLEK